MPKHLLTNDELTSLVDRVKAGDERAVEDLYLTMRRFATYWIVRQVGAQDYEDMLHDTFVSVLRVIQAGELHTNSAVLGYTRTIVHRKIAQRIEDLRRARKHRDIDGCFNHDGSAISSMFFSRQNPEKAAEFSQRTAIMAEEIRKLSAKHQEILQRFYLDGQRPVAIMQAMGLTDTTFRLHKSRAKKRLERLVAKRLQRSTFGHQLAKAA